MTIEIREVTEEDRVWVVTVACKNMMTYDMKRPDLYHPPSLHQLFEKTLRDKTGFVAWDAGRRVGCISGLIVPHHLHTDREVMTESLWYIEGRYRTGRTGYLLLKKYTEFAHSRVYESIFTLPHYSQLKDDSLIKLGWKPYERVYNHIRN